ncbi:MULTISPECIES: ATP-binding cassette domain-containing protein [unclassified Phyllobacterium]|uniref:ATP-binding cassette domain-containing protein n=1 Tax=unclassified Phyllobacterium TaxID=2638441 RepID=UPI003012B8B8
MKQEVTIAHPLHTLEGVSFHVRLRPIIEKMNPTVEEGRIHGLIGANGSGKSMLIKVLAQQQKPSSGNISFSGRYIETLLQRGFARKIACLWQFMPATDGMNVEKFDVRGRFSWHGTFGRFAAQDRPR